VLEWVDACDPKPLVIVDSLVSYLEGSENDSAEIRKYMDGYRQLANRGVAVLLLHHTGKADSAKDYRGSSDIKGSVDLAYNLANLGDPSRLTTLRLRAFKSRFTAQTEVVLNYTDGRFLASSEEARPNNHEILVSLLRKHPGVRVAEFEAIAVEKGVRRERARTFLKTGVESNQIRVDFGGHNTRNHTWVGDGQDGPNEPF
jgi:RecA-family ATPase